MTDGTGTRQYAYVPVGSLGALQLQQESGPLASSAITSAYDALGRLSSRTVQGAGVETFAYDPIGRLSTRANDLGSFTLGYLGQTGQITSRALASSTLATTSSYLTNTDDRRLSGINNTGLSAGQFSNYSYTTTPENFISAITETNDLATVYPAARSQTATYNNLNQLTNLSGQAITFDAVGNVTSDGTRNYTWDAENRLVGITYPGVSGKATAFTYDGLGRRVTIASTPPGGGSATTTSYLWCGSVICQARNAGNTAIRSYYSEGELVPGTPNQPFYYGKDQIGSVRRAFASTSSAPACSYDPYGIPLQATAPVTDLVYAGMFFNADSGLYLTKNRVFDPVAGRWLSRDRLGEKTDPTGNLYSYVSGNPIIFSDPEGKQAEIAIGGAIVCGPVCWAAILGGAAIVGGAILYQQLQPAAEKPRPMNALPPGFLPGNVGAEEWGRRHGVDPDEARRQFHRKKQQDPMSRPTDVYGVNPDTGQICDPEGETIDILE
jgi:RHS repeat-associated protein